MKVNKVINILIITVLVQFFCLILFTIAYQTDYFHLIISQAIVFTLQLFLLSRLYITKSKDIEYQVKKSSYENIKKINLALKAQRHDFLNHIQVIYGLLQLDKNEQAKKYILEYYSEIKKINSAIKTENVVLNTLIQSKVKKAEDYDVDISFDIDSNLDNIHMQDWELSAMLSNIIDNAIDACKDLPKEMRRIEVDIFDDDVNHVFIVNNSGPRIDPKQLDKIFEPGFTTKGEHGNGLGLYIVTNIVSKYKGKINVESDEKNGTTFKIQIPIQIK